MSPTFKTVIKGLSNVFYDDSSTYNFDVLNESLFLEDTFIALSRLMDDAFDDYLFFILSSHDAHVMPLSISYRTNKKKVLIFISEEAGDIPKHLSQQYYAVFKSYIKADKVEEKNIFNFAIGCVTGVPELPIKQLNSRKYFVFFSGSLNNSRMHFYRAFIPWLKSKKSTFLSSFIRQQKILVRLKPNFSKRFPNSYIRFTNGFKKGVKPETYGKLIADSKIVLCPRGAKSSESFRHYEAMRAGCVLVSEELPKNHFYENSPIIQVDNWTDGLQKTSELLNNDVELEKIAIATYEWWSEKCSPKAVSKFMDARIRDLH